MLVGELKLNAMLDRERQATYNLTVKAIDTGSPPNNANQTIHITVTDVNDNPPVFVQKSYTAHVLEQQGSLQSVCNWDMVCISWYVIGIWCVSVGM